MHTATEIKPKRSIDGENLANEAYLVAYYVDWTILAACKHFSPFSHEVSILSVRGLRTQAHNSLPES